MDVRISPEQQALRDSVVTVVDRLGPKTVADLSDVDRVAKLDSVVAGCGWRELRGDGGSGRPWASGVEVALVAEELGRGVADVAFLGPTLAVEVRRLLRVAPGDERETVSLTSDLRTAGATFAVDAAGATKVLARSGDELVLTELLDEPFGVDLTRPMRGVGVGGTNVASINDAQLVRWTALGLSGACADLVGVMQGATDLACEYAKERRQYGAAIGSYQAVQHLLADALVLTEGSRSITLHAAWAVDALDPPDALAAAASAKAYCARAARTVCETAIQVHGGIGNTWECMAHVFLRRALLSIDLLGGIGPSLQRVLTHHRIGGHDGLR